MFKANNVIVMLEPCGIRSRVSFDRLENSGCITSIAEKKIKPIVLI